MLIDKQGKFLSQRQQPDMARIQTALTTDSLLVNTSDFQQLEIPLNENSGQIIPVQIWKDQCAAAIVSPEASRWFSSFLSIDCDLVYLPESEQRQVDTAFATSKQLVGFADGFPLLVVSKSSIDLLNEKLGEQVGIDRFRPNIVIDGCKAHAEDLWSKVTINDIDIELVKPCSRCIIPGINQQTAEKHTSLLKTLASYRRTNGKVYFGQNGLHQRNGNISVGQIIISVDK